MANGTQTAAQAVQQKPRLTPAQRNLLFAQATRQNWQRLPSVTGQAGQTVSFDLPKVRLTSRIRLLVEATLTVTHASATSYTPARFAPYSLLRAIRVDINNGFSPWRVSGIGAYLANLARPDAGSVMPVFDTPANLASRRERAVQGTAASTSGAANPVRFVVDLPLVLNDRDPIGLVMTQNQETVVTVAVDLGQASDLLASTTGYTLALSDVTITPMVESFSVPVSPDAIPDLSILKLVQEQTNRTVAGVHTEYLKVGMTYRRIIVDLVDDTTGNALTDSDVGTFELVFNQADTPYRVPARMLAAINQEQLGKPLPAGVWLFDFSYQGIVGLGGSRDYVDTERLTEFWLRFDYGAAARLRVVYEVLSQLL